jgi:hypothetical protein
MHDPLTMVLMIRRPWPRRDPDETRYATRDGIRWRRTGGLWVVAGKGLYWPSVGALWHRDPSGYDDTTCRGKRWRLHVHHWRLQVQPLQALRRRLLTRCVWCQGRDRKGDPVNVSHSWDRARGHWWQGETGLFHHDCSSIERAHASCACEHPVLVNKDYGRCARCMHFRPFGVTPERLAQVRELARIPHGERSRV